VQDVTRLRQILVNLLSNGVKFTPSGEVAVRVTAVSPHPAGRIKLAFAVSDTGIGIPADRLDRLFQSFSQVDRSTTRRYGGTGLGLAICKRLSELMGGDIRVESSVGRGTTFTFTIGAGRPAPSSMRRVAAAGEANQLFNPNMGQQHPLRILIAEDNLINQKVALRMLDRLGYTADVVTNGQQALTALDRRTYDVILMDVQMPEMDGVTATKTIRATLAPERQPVIIALTANAMQGDRETYLAAGMDYYLSKPMIAAALVETLAGVPAANPRLYPAD